MKGVDVKKILKENGYSMSKIATDMGITQQNLDSNLRAKDVSSGVLERICLAIDKPLSFFYGDQFGSNSVEDTQKLIDDTRKVIEILMELNDARKELESTRSRIHSLELENIFLKKGDAIREILATGTDPVDTH